MRILVSALAVSGLIYAAWRAFRLAECATEWFLRLLSGDPPDDNV